MCMCMVTKREDKRWRKIILSIFFLCLFFKFLLGSFWLLIQSTNYWYVHISNYKHISFYCDYYYNIIISLYCTSVLIFKQIEGSQQWCMEQVYRRHCPTACSHFMALHHSLLILTFQTSSLPLYLLLWFVAGNLWCYHFNCFDAPWMQSFKMADLINVMCVLTAPPAAIPPSLSLHSNLPVPWDTKYWN